MISVGDFERVREAANSVDQMIYVFVRDGMIVLNSLRPRVNRTEQYATADEAIASLSSWAIWTP